MNKLERDTHLVFSALKKVAHDVYQTQGYEQREAFLKKFQDLIVSIHDIADCWPIRYPADRKPADRSEYDIH